MITEQAIVTRCHGKRVELELQRGSACAQCELSQGCGTGALGRLLGKRSKPLVIETDHDLKPGDKLQLGLSESALVKASLIVYGLPLLGMLVAGLLASFTAVSETLIALAAAAGFIVGFKFAVYLSHTLEHDRLTPYIVEIRVNPGPELES
jgi:sigma-E factor negative regulatory protein RseC